mgnify:CR=1 FL=1
MSLSPFRDIKRKKTKEINVGKVKVGGNNPISVQSMTNTLTTDVEATVKQINELQAEGADIVRVSCPDELSSKALKEIIKHVDVPIVADIHFHYKRAIEAAKNGAACLAAVVPICVTKKRPSAAANTLFGLAGNQSPVFSRCILDCILTY